jgi:hypothetical protein
LVSNGDSEMMRLGSDYTSMYKMGDDTSSVNSFNTDMRRIDNGSISVKSGSTYMKRVIPGGKQS